MGEGEEKEGGSVIFIALGVCEQQHHQKPLYAPLFSQPAKSFTSSPPPRKSA